MKHGKQILYFVLALVLILSTMAGCTSGTDATEPSESQTQPTAESTNPTEMTEATETTESANAMETTASTQVTEATEPTKETEPVHTHSWNAATCTAPKTCKTCGTTDGAANGHSWTEATCTAPKTCAICGATDGAANGHSWTEATCTTPKTCAICGATEGDTASHNYVNGACSVCGAADTKLSFHDRTWKLDALSGTQLNRIELRCEQGTGNMSVEFWSEYGTGTPFQFDGKTYYSDNFGKSADLEYTENGDTVTMTVSAYGGLNVGTLTLQRISDTQYKVTAVSGTIISDSITSAVTVGSIFAAA